MTADMDERTLRPQRLEDFTGQDMPRRRLQVALYAALKRGESLEHVLLSGPPGLGKTTLAQIVASELGGRLVATSGPALERTADLFGMLSKLRTGDVLFIDEIHRTPRTLMEYLYSAMEDFLVDFTLTVGKERRALRIPLKRFTLVGATTHAGMLPGPMRDRFGLDFPLQFYSAEALALIVKRSAGLLGMDIEPAAAAEIARRSRGTPRIANKLLRRVRDFAELYAGETVNLDMTDRALALEGIDSLGLDELDRKYLLCLIEHYNGGPAGLGALGASLQLESVTLEEMIEPYLLAEGFLRRLSRGRQATERAYRHLGITDAAAA